MTTTTHTVAALLVAAVAALELQNSTVKKTTGEPLFALGEDMGNGVKWRELKAWLKDFKAKQKEVTPPAAKVAAAKENAPKTTGRKPKVETETLSNVRDLEIAGSSNIESATYDRDAKVLRINFKNGSVYDYANVAIREARNMEKAESAGKFFAENIKGQKEFTKVKAAAPRVAASAPKATAKADAKPAAKATPKAAPKAEAVEYKTSELRGAELLNGRKVEVIEKVVAAKEGEGRDVITDAKNRYAVASLRKNNRGRFVVEVAAPAKEETVKAPRKNSRANFEETKEAANNTRKAKELPAMPKIADVKGAEVRVIKGSKDKMVKIIRVVNRDGVGRVAITEAKGVLPFGQIILNDDVLTYTGKLTAEEYRAL
jgi:hypothetical protein